MLINPVLKNEMKRMARSRQLIWIVMVFNIIMSLATLLLYDQIRLTQTAFGTSVWTNVTIVFAVIMTMEICMLTLFVPPIAGGSIAGEYEHQTMEILLSSRLGAFEIIAGKLLSSISLTLLLMVSCLPVDMMMLSFGGMPVHRIIMPLLYTVFFALLAGSIGVFFSGLLRRTTPATIATYGIILLLTVGMLAFVMMMHMVFDNVSGAAPLLHFLIYLLLLNPALTFSAIVMHIFDGTNILADMALTNTIAPVIVNHWVFVSLTAQTVLIVILIVFSVRHMDPLRKRGKRHA